MTPVEAVREALSALSPTRLLCAVSGGGDSVALLYALYLLQEQMGFHLEALHVQHGLRGETSLADEDLVRSLCAQWRVPLTVAQANLNGSMEDPGMETQARNRRRELFEQAMQAKSIPVLLTAHHRDDQAETVLMHLLRGAGLDGLCAMRSATAFGGGTLLRPFLHLGKQELLDWLAAEGIAYRTDESNLQAITPRNHLRLNGMPALAEAFPGAARHMAELADTLQADSDCLNQLADQLYEDSLMAGPGLLSLRKGPLMQAHPAILRRALRRLAREGAAQLGLSPRERSLSREDTLALEALASAPVGQALNLPLGLKALCGGAHLFLLRQDDAPLSPIPHWEPVAVSSRQRYYDLPWAQIIRREGGLPDTADVAILPDEVLSQSPVFRAPEPEDIIHPLGAPGSKPLRRFLTDRHIDLPLRPLLTVLAVGHQILWIPGLCTSEALRAAPDGQGLRLQGAVPFLPHQTKE